MTESLQPPSTDCPKPQLPGFWKFCWMFWMQPILLHQRLKECGIDEPDASAIRLWRVDDSHHPMRRQYVVRLAAMLIVISLIDLIAIAGSAVCRGGVGYENLGIGILALATAIGVTTFSSVAFGVAFGVPFLVGIVIADAIGGDVAYRAASAAALGTTFGVVGKKLRGVQHIMFGCLLWFVYDVLHGELTGVRGGVSGGIAGGVAFTVAMLRIPILPIEIILSFLSRSLARVFGGSPLRFSPVSWHDLCPFPLPGLRQQLLDLK